MYPLDTYGGYHGFDPILPLPPQCEQRLGHKYFSTLIVTARAFKFAGKYILLSFKYLLWEYFWAHSENKMAATGSLDAKSGFLAILWHSSRIQKAI